MKIPLQEKLKKGEHKALAYAQDVLIMEVYRFFSKPILHGGTAIWRCYSGNRFSEDLDFYFSAQDKEKIKEFPSILSQRGFEIKKWKVSHNILYSKLAYNGHILRFEVFFKEIKDFVLKEFELTDGSFTGVYTLKIEELLLEKINASLDRKKIRDLYDVFFLVPQTELNEKINLKLRELVTKYQLPPDAATLSALVISGLAPSPSKILEAIRVWVK